MSMNIDDENYLPISHINSKSLYSENRGMSNIGDNEKLTSKNTIHSRLKTMKKKRKSKIYKHLEELSDLKQREKILKEKLIISLSKSSENSYIQHESMPINRKTLKIPEIEWNLSNFYSKKVNSSKNVLNNLKFFEEKSSKLPKKGFSKTRFNDNFDLSDQISIKRKPEESDIKIFQNNKINSLNLIKKRHSHVNENIAKVNTVLSKHRKSYFTSSILLAPNNSDEKKNLVENISISDEEIKLKKKLLSEKIMNLKVQNEFSYSIEDNASSNFELINPAKRVLKKINKMETGSSASSNDEESKNFIKQDKFIFHPDCFFKEIWDYIVFILLIYLVIVGPLTIAFDSMNNLTFSIINYLVDCFYFADLILNFFVGYYDFEENLILEFKKVFKNYLLSSFFLDLISGVPLNLIVLLIINNDSTTIAPQTPLNIITFLKLIRLFKLSMVFKFMKIGRFFNLGHESTKINILLELTEDSTKLRIIKFAFYFMMFTHISTCIWIFMAKLDFPNWVVLTSYPNYQDWDIYIASLYFTLTTIFTVGYGDILSVSLYERFYNILLMIVGIFLYSYAITSLSSLLAFQDQKTKLYISSLDTLDEIKDKFEFDNKLYDRIKKFLTNDYLINRIDKNIVINILPTTLKNKMTTEIFRVALENLKFFKKTCSEFKIRAATMLKKTRFFKGDYLVKENEWVEELFFLMKGILKVEKETDLGKLSILNIFMYEHFGDVYMNSNIKSPVDLKVKTKIAEVYIMTKADFTTLSEEFPNQIKETIKKAIINTMKLELRLRKRYKFLKTKFGFYQDMKNFQKILTKFDKNQNLVDRNHIEEQKITRDNPGKTLPEIAEEDEISFKMNKGGLKQHSSSIVLNQNSNSSKKEASPTLKNNLSKRHTKCNANDFLNRDSTNTNEKKIEKDININRTSIINLEIMKKINNQTNISETNQNLVQTNQSKSYSEDYYLKKNNEFSNKYISSIYNYENREENKKSTNLNQDSLNTLKNHMCDKKMLTLNNQHNLPMNNASPIDRFSTKNDSAINLKNSLNKKNQSKQKSVFVYNNIIQKMKINANIFKNPSNFLVNKMPNLLQKVYDQRDEIINQKLDNMISRLNSVIIKK